MKKNSTIDDVATIHKLIATVDVLNGYNAEIRTQRQSKRSARLVPRPTIQPGTITWAGVYALKRSLAAPAATESEEPKDPSLARDVSMFLAGGLVAWLGAFLAYFLGA